MSQLGDFIESEREFITQRWVDQLFATTAPGALNREDVIDSLREFLDEIIVALRREHGFHEHTHTTITSALAKGHGKQRFLMGYDVAAMVREYGTLRDVLFQVMDERGVTPTVRELRVLSKYLHSAIADATSQYALERDEEMQKQAAQHMSFLAHELRSPVASALLALVALKRKGQLPKGPPVEVLTLSLERVDTLISNALLEMRLRALPAPLREPVALEDLLRDLEAEIAIDLETKGIRLHIEVPAGLSLMADRKLLHSALSNLVRNAIKFSREGATIHLRAQEAGERMRLDVEDECGGLPEGRMQALFNPFVQAGKDRSGFGLGLAITKQAIEAHGGELRVHNLPGKGCIFVVDMPTDPSPPVTT